jgi:hypothetical protein
MRREGLRRLLWVGSLLLALFWSHFLLIRYGAQWGLGAAP